MKRIVCAVVCVCMLLLLCPAAGAEAGPVPIGSREDLMKIAEDPAGSFELTGDIDMGGADWIPLSFSGTLEGHGHTLYNLTVTAPAEETLTTYDGNLKEYETVFGGLFSVVRDAQIREVNLVNAVVNIETDRHCFIAALAGYAERSTIANCSVQARNHLTLTSVNAGVGGLVGFSVENEISECTVEAELVFTDTNRDQLCEEFIGGIYASGYGNIADCVVRIKGFAEVFGYCHNGGLIGMYKRPNNSRYRTHVSRCESYTEFSFFEITRSRRAYCSSTIGEDSKREVNRQKLYTGHFSRFESKTPVRLAPETCDAPQYATEVTPGDCTTWGYTTYTCQGCGYSYRDHYTPPMHQYAATEIEPATCTEGGKIEYRCTHCGQSYFESTPPTGHEYQESVTEPICTEAGERVFTCKHCQDRYTEPIPPAGHTPGDWVQTLAPQVNVPGEEQLRCSICGDVLERREVPALPYIYADTVTLSADALALTVGQTTRLTAVLAPDTATDPSCSFTSSDETVATVTADGTVLGVGPGSATVSAVSGDERASAACTVTVSFTPWQWVKHYVLFGWLWE